MLGMLVVVSVDDGDSAKPHTLVRRDFGHRWVNGRPVPYAWPEWEARRTPIVSNVIYQEQYSPPKQSHDLSPRVLRVIWIMVLIFEGFVCFLASIIFLMGFYQV